MATRRGLGKGKGKGYKNIIPKDPRVHSDSRHGRKQPQRIPNMEKIIKEIQTDPSFDILNKSSTKEKEQIIKELEQEGKKLERYDIEKSFSPLKKNKSGTVILYQHFMDGKPTGLYYEVAYYFDGTKQLLMESE